MNWKWFIHVTKINERAARVKCKQHQKKAKIQFIKEIFDKLAYEEEVHIGVLEKFEKDLKALLADEKKR